MSKCWIKTFLHFGSLEIPMATHVLMFKHVCELSIQRDRQNQTTKQRVCGRVTVQISCPHAESIMREEVHVVFE